MLCTRFDDIDPETGIEVKRSFSETFKDVYPIHVLENRDGIQGSCAFFTQRTDVTKHIRSKSFTPLLKLHDVLERLVHMDCFSKQNETKMPEIVICIFNRFTWSDMAESLLLWRPRRCDSGH